MGQNSSVKPETRNYLNAIPRHSKDYESAQHVLTLETMGATPLEALYVVEKKCSRKFVKTIERLEHVHD